MVIRHSFLALRFHLDGIHISMRSSTLPILSINFCLLCWVPVCCWYSLRFWQKDMRHVVNQNKWSTCKNSEASKASVVCFFQLPPRDWTNEDEEGELHEAIVVHKDGSLDLFLWIIDSVFIYSVQLCGASKIFQGPATHWFWTRIDSLSKDRTRNGSVFLFCLYLKFIHF